MIQQPFSRSGHAFLFWKQPAQDGEQGRALLYQVVTDFAQSEIELQLTSWRLNPNLTQKIHTLCH